MATIYYSMLDDDARSKISFLIVNAGSASADRADLERAARYNSGGTIMGPLPVYQDDRTSTLLNAISNNDPYPKDDIALFDREGRVVSYWESNQSFLGGTTNLIIQKVREVTADGYVSPCGPAVDPETEQPGGELSLSQFRDLCQTSTDNCRACRGKIKNGECRVKIKSCKKVRTEEMCRAARCKVKVNKKKNKVKCKNKNGSVFD